MTVVISAHSTNCFLPDTHVVETQSLVFSSASSQRAIVTRDVLTTSSQLYSPGELMPEATPNSSDCTKSLTNILLTQMKAEQARCDFNIESSITLAGCLPRHEQAVELLEKTRKAALSTVPAGFGFMAVVVCSNGLSKHSLYLSLVVPNFRLGKYEQNALVNLFDNDFTDSRPISLAATVSPIVRPFNFNWLTVELSRFYLDTNNQSCYFIGQLKMAELGPLSCVAVLVDIASAESVELIPCGMHIPRLYESIKRVS